MKLLSLITLFALTLATLSNAAPIPTPGQLLVKAFSRNKYRPLVNPAPRTGRRPTSPPKSTSKGKGKEPAHPSSSSPPPGTAESHALIPPVRDESQAPGPAVAPRPATPLANPASKTGRRPTSPSKSKSKGKGKEAAHPSSSSPPPGTAESHARSPHGRDESQAPAPAPADVPHPATPPSPSGERPHSPVFAGPHGEPARAHGDSPIYRGSDKKNELTGGRLRHQDFHMTHGAGQPITEENAKEIADEHRTVHPSKAKGLSFNVNREAAAVGPRGRRFPHVHEVRPSDLHREGFGTQHDGIEYGGPNPEGHVSVLYQGPEVASSELRDRLKQVPSTTEQ